MLPPFTSCSMSLSLQALISVVMLIVIAIVRL